MPKRGENIYKRRDGRWEGRITYSAYLQEGRKYQSVYGKTYGEVKRKLDEAKQEKCFTCGRCTVTMKEAVNIWYADKREEWKEGTYAVYRQTVEKYIIPHLGGLPLYKINNQVMAEFAAKVRRQNEGQRLSNVYLFYICGVVQRVMTHIQKRTGESLEIPANPVSVERRSKMELPEIRELSVLENYLLKNTEDDTCLGILTALHTGLRIGELCALTWKDIDLETAILHIRSSIQRVRDYDSPGKKTRLAIMTPKTSCSVRDIPIPPVLLDALSSCRKDFSCKLVSGVRGDWMDPRTLQYRFQKILEECGISHFNFHMLRHAFATRCMEKGFDSKSLSEILGHSSIQITLNLYVHSTLQRKRCLMSLVDSYSCDENRAAAGI